MGVSPILIESFNQLSARAKGELRLWLETFQEYGVNWDEEGTGAGGSGGGTSASVQQYEIYGIQGTNVAAGATTALVFGAHTGDPITTSASSTTRLFTNDGYYSIDVTVYCSTLTVGRGFLVQIGTIGTQWSGAVASTGLATTYCGRTVVNKIGATSALTISVTNGDTSARDFYLSECRICRLA